jgi:hypothetical protein
MFGNPAAGLRGSLVSDHTGSVNGLGNRFGLRTWDALDKTQECFGAGHIGEAHFPVISRQFEPVTVCHQLTSFLAKPLFQLIPVFSSHLKVRLLSQDLNDVYNGEKPGFGILIASWISCSSMLKYLCSNRDGSKITLTLREIDNAKLFSIVYFMSYQKEATPVQRLPAMGTHPAARPLDLMEGVALSTPG